MNTVGPGQNIPPVAPSNRCSLFSSITQKFSSISSSIQKSISESASKAKQAASDTLSARKAQFGKPDSSKVESYRKVLQQHGGTPQLEKSINLISNGIVDLFKHRVPQALANNLPYAIEGLLTAALANIAKVVAPANDPHLLTSILNYLVSVVNKHMDGKSARIREIEKMAKPLQNAELSKLLEPLHQELIKLVFPNGAPDLGLNSVMNSAVKWFLSFLEDPNNSVILYNCIINPLTEAKDRRQILEPTDGGKVLLQITTLVSEQIPPLLLDYLSYRCDEKTLLPKPIGPVTESESLTHDAKEEAKKRLTDQIGHLARNVPTPLKEFAGTLLDSAATKLFLHLAENKIVEKKINGVEQYALEKVTLQSNEDPLPRVIKHIKGPLKKFYKDCAGNLKVKLQNFRKCVQELAVLEAQPPHTDPIQENDRQNKIKQLKDSIEEWYNSNERIEITNTSFAPLTEVVLKVTGMDKTEGLKLDFTPFINALLTSLRNSKVLTMLNLTFAVLGKDPIDIPTNVDAGNLNKTIFKDLVPYGLFCLVEWAITNYPGLLDWLDPESGVSVKKEALDRETGTTAYSDIAKTASGVIAEHLLPPLLNSNADEWSIPILDKIDSLLPLNLNSGQLQYQPNKVHLQNLAAKGFRNIASRSKGDQLMQFASAHIEEGILTAMQKNSSGPNSNPIENMIHKCIDLFIELHTTEGPKIAAEYAKLPKNPSSKELEALYNQFQKVFEKLSNDILVKTDLETLFTTGMFSAFNLSATILPALQRKLFTLYLPFSNIYLQNLSNQTETVLQVGDLAIELVGKALPSLINSNAENIASVLTPLLAPNSASAKNVLVETIQALSKSTIFQKILPLAEPWMKLMFPQAIGNAIESTTPLTPHNLNYLQWSVISDLAGRVCEAAGDCLKLLNQRKQELTDLNTQVHVLTSIGSPSNVLSNLTQRIQAIYKTCTDPLLNIVRGGTLDRDPLNCLPISNDRKQHLWNIVFPEKLSEFLIGMQAVTIPEVDQMQKELFAIFKSNHVSEYCRYLSRFASEAMPYKMRTTPGTLSGQLLHLVESMLSSCTHGPGKALFDKLMLNKDPIQNMFTETLGMLGSNMDRDGIMKDYICPFLEEYTYPLLLSLMVKFSKVLQNIKVSDPDYNVKLLTGLLKIGARYLKKMNEITVKNEVSSIYELSKNEVFAGLGANLHPSLKVNPKATPEEIRQKRMEHVYTPCTKEILELLNFKAADINAPSFLQESLFVGLESHLGPVLLEMITTIFFKEDGKEATIDKLEEVLLNNMEAALKALDNYTSVIEKTEQTPPTDAQNALTEQLLIQCAEILHEMVQMIPEYFLQKFLSLNTVKKMTSTQLAAMLKQMCHDWPLTTLIDIVAEKSLPAICEGQWKGVGKHKKFVSVSRDIKIDETDVQQKHRLIEEENRALENKNRMAKIATEGIFIGIKIFFQNILDKIANAMLWLSMKLFGKKHGTNLHHAFLWACNHIGTLFAWILSPVYQLINWLIYVMLMKDYSGHAHRTLKHRAHINLVYAIMQFTISSLKKEALTLLPTP